MHINYIYDLYILYVTLQILLFNYRTIASFLFVKKVSHLK